MDRNQMQIVSGNNRCQMKMCRGKLFSYSDRLIVVVCNGISYLYLHKMNYVEMLFVMKRKSYLRLLYERKNSDHITFLLRTTISISIHIMKICETSHTKIYVIIDWAAMYHSPYLNVLICVTAIFQSINIHEHLFNWEMWKDENGVNSRYLF